MILMAAVDDNMGLMFNHRRQSRDRLLRQRILALAGDRTLWMDRYSAALFGAELDGHTVRVEEDFLAQAAPGDFCFLEDRSPGLRKKTSNRWSSSGGTAPIPPICISIWTSAAGR